MMLFERQMKHFSRMENIPELSDSWLIDALSKIAWETDSQGKSVTVIDRSEDHRLVEVNFLTASGRPSRARILHGIDDGAPFWIRVIRSLNEVNAAIKWLKPQPVIRAEAKKIPVIRQGDWFFIKCQRFVPDTIAQNVRYGNHIIEFWSRGQARGTVSHGEHNMIYLDDWHTPCRCRGWHTLSMPARIHNQQYWIEQIRKESL